MPLSKSSSFILRLTHQDSFDYVQEKHPDIVAISSKGEMTGNVIDFCGLPTVICIRSMKLTILSLLGAIRDVCNVEGDGDQQQRLLRTNT